MAKGSRREREAVDLYQRAGMATYRPATVQYGENDIAGLFDLLAFSPSHTAVHAVQVKSNGARGVTHWQRHTALFRRLGWRTFYLIPYDSQGWRLVEVFDDERVDRVDGRIRDKTDVAMGERVTEWLEGPYGRGE
jgi:Holliday junction resolvase